MKNKKRVLAALLYAILMPLVSGAHAQSTPDSPEVEASSVASARVSKKEIRLQNRKLASRVRHSLFHTKNLDASDVRVLTRHGYVSLEGTVPDQGQADLAGQVVSKVAGVVGVTNNLTMREVGQ